MSIEADKIFYVYQHLRADTGEVFYVGKGKGKRLTSRGRNEYWKRIVEKHGLIVEVIAEKLTETDAFELEVSTIRRHKEAGLKLANMTDGGEGTVGRLVTQESRVNYRLSRLGEKNPMHGKSHGEAIKEKIRQASIVNHAKPDVKEKIKKALTGLVRTDEVKEKIRQARIGTNRSDETKAKQSALKKGKPSNRLGAKLSDGDQTALTFVKVLDEISYGLVEEDEPVAEPTDRSFWEKKGSRKSLEIVDKLMEIVTEVEPQASLKYNGHYIGLYLNGAAFNFINFRPQKSSLVMKFKLPKTKEYDEIIENSGLEVLPYEGAWKQYRLRVEPEITDEQRAAILELATQAKASFRKNS